MVGSWPVGLASKGQTCIDVNLVIPKQCWEQDDHLNYRYHRKRALYLSYVAAHLRNRKDLIRDIEFDALEADPARPLLILHPEGKLNARATIRLLASPPPDFVSIDQLLGREDNWLYNTGIMADMRMSDIAQHTIDTLSTKKNIVDACILLGMWHRHRQLNSGNGAFSMFILTQYVVYLTAMGRIHPKMSHYQVLRTVWLNLARSDWTTEGISLPLQQGAASSSIADAHGAFSLVFLDSTGSLNLCANVSTTTYDWLKWEAHLAVGLLNEKSIDSFGVLFKTPKPFLLSFDNVVLFNMDAADNYGHKSRVDQICQCLSKGLGQRVKLTAYKSSPSEPWALQQEPSSKQKFALGFSFNAPAAWEVLDKGPAADDPQSAEFRAFWGEKSELRRFQDGFVCEAVHWPATNWAQRRLICRSIVTYLLESRLNVDAEDLHYVSDQLDSFLSLTKLEEPQSYGTGEEACRSALEVLDALTKNLRNLDELPLMIAQVQGTAATFRYAETFPPLPDLSQGSSKLFARTQGCLLPTAQMTPLYCPSLKVLLTLETSGKWPDDVDAVQRVKAAFYLKLGQRLHLQFKLTAKVFPDRVLVVQDGYVFNLVIAYQRDIALLKRTVDDGVVKYRDNAQSQLLDRDINILPR